MSLLARALLVIMFVTILSVSIAAQLPMPPMPKPKPPPGGQAPAAPSNLTATAISQSQINLIWQDNSNNEQGFKIERKTQGGSYSQITSVSANMQNYNDTGLNSGTNYCYRVRAYNANGESAPSNEACATTQGGGTTPPPSPGPGNQLPVAAFTYSPQNPKPGEVITFDCSPSSDPDGSIISCRWDFGGQGTHVSEQGKQHQHKFDREGTYTVKLTVKDNAGAESSTSQTIVVRSGATPPGQGQGPQITSIGIPKTLELEVPTDWEVGFYDPDGDINRIKFESWAGSEWIASGEWDPGVTEVTQGIIGVQTTCHQLGTVKAKVTLYDSAGHSSTREYSFDCVEAGTPSPPPQAGFDVFCALSYAIDDSLLQYKEIEILRILDAWIKKRAYNDCGVPDDRGMLRVLDMWIKNAIPLD